MAPSNQSASLQIPQLDVERGSSRQGGHNVHTQPASAAAYRPASVAVHSGAPASAHPGSSSARRQQRASHSVVSGSSNSQDTAQGQQRQENQAPQYPDVYSHPAAVAYAAAHPRRTIPKFGPYLLLQTLGEGEFGKVKLGLHCQWGEEVAVKLIRRGNMGQDGRMAKVEREIEVLRTLKHPNIVRLYDVIETDKYIGIILEYASGGELFDHILAHRHLRERDAAKLFHQLISGVWYIHQKKIVHRDLKLENLLLDRHRNVIITDFGFANRFENKADDLMQTSCGSPCYAAPELVISDGHYVGTAVDIWSCGVILYAMLAGYLPFDDDPANPDGDNINLLYRYIVNTPLSFPEHISSDARDLLGLMLVPDPTRRANLDTVMRHSWLSAWAGTLRTDGVPSAFGKSVADLERAAMEQHQQKRLAYQRQMRAATATNNPPPSASRSHSHRGEATSAAPSSSRTRSVQPEFIYDSSADQSVTQGVNTTPKQNGAASSTFDSPARLGLTDDDPFAPPAGAKANSVIVTTTTTTTSATSRQRTSEEIARQQAAASLMPPDAKSSPSSKGHRSSASGGGSARHTIQVEYAEPKGSRRSEDRTRDRSGSQGQSSSQAQAPPPPPELPTHQRTPTKERRPSNSGAVKPLPPSPSVPPPAPSSFRGAPLSIPKEAPQSSNTASKAPSTPEIPTVNVSSPPPTPSVHQFQQREKDKDTSSQTSGSSRRGSHRKGKSSVDKLGISKIFGGGSSSPAPPVPALNGSAHNLQSPQLGAPARTPSEGQASASSVASSETPGKDAPPKKTRRNTLTVMVEPFIGTIRRGKGKTPATPTTAASKAAPETPAQPTRPPLPTTPAPPLPAAPQPSTEGSVSQQEMSVDDGSGMSASTNKARKVMQWFRTKSKGRESIGLGHDGDFEVVNSPVTDARYKKPFSASSTNVNHPTASSNGSTSRDNLASPQVLVTQSAAPPSTPKALKPPTHPQRSASSAAEFSTPSFVTRFRNSVTVGGMGGSSRSQSSPNVTANTPNGQLRTHVGAVDYTMITTKPPPEVMAHIKTVLEGMGVEVQQESEYKYRCIRAKKRKGAAAPTSPSLAAVQVSGSAASNGVDKRGLPLPSPSAFTGTGNMLKGLLMRRQSSQVSGVSAGPSVAFDDENSVVVSEPLVMSDIAYGDPSQDAGDEVRISVELTRLEGLSDTFSLDIRRLKGNLRSYKYLYETIRQRADLKS